MTPQMTPRRCARVLVAVGSLCSAGFAAIAWAHHPLPRPDASGAPSWALLWLLGAGIFVVAFVATFVVFSILERRQRAGSSPRQSVRRS